MAILAYIPDLASFSDAEKLASYVGLAPVVAQSGKTLDRAALPRAGKRTVRRALYFPALVATKNNPDVQALHQRLVERGKHPKVVIAAAMHKLLRIAYGVLKHGQPYQPQMA